MITCTIILGGRFAVLTSSDPGRSHDPLLDHVHGFGTSGELRGPRGNVNQSSCTGAARIYIWRQRPNEDRHAAREVANAGAYIPFSA